MTKVLWQIRKRIHPSIKYNFATSISHDINGTKLKLDQQIQDSSRVVFLTGLVLGRILKSSHISDFTGLSLLTVDFEGLDLSEKNFSHTVLAGKTKNTKFVSSDLHDADLSNLESRDSDFSFSTLEGTVLSMYFDLSTNKLSGADWWNAINFTGGFGNALSIRFKLGVLESISRKSCPTVEEGANVRKNRKPPDGEWTISLCGLLTNSASEEQRLKFEHAAPRAENESRRDDQLKKSKRSLKTPTAIVH